MKLAFLCFLLALGQIAGAQSHILNYSVSNPDQAVIDRIPDERLTNASSCDFDINNFTGLYTFYDLQAPSETSLVTITLDPETENGLIIKWLYSDIFNVDTATAVPFRITLDESDEYKINWIKQLAVADMSGYGPGTAEAGTGTYDPCSNVMNMSLKMCVQLGCFGGFFNIRLEPCRDAGEVEDYYWVGGSGNWSDYPDHWATSSGGSVFHDKLPDANDNVYFDDLSSGSEDNPVIEGQTALCGNFKYSSTKEMELSISQFNVYENFSINNNIIPKIETLILLDDTIHEFKTFNKPFVNVNFSGPGPFTVNDTLKASNITISGAVKFSPVTQCNSIKVEKKDASSLDIFGSHVYVYNFTLEVLPVNFKSDSSTIFLSSSLQGPGYTFNKIIVSGNVSIECPNKVDTIHINESCSLFLWGYGTIDVKKLIANGTESGYLTISGHTSYIKNTIEADTIKYVIIDGVHAVGGIADIYAPDCILKNGASGWIGAKHYQEISYKMIENVPVTEENVVVQATSTSGLPVFMKLIRGDGYLENNVFYPHGKGIVEIEISQEGGVNYTWEFVPAKKVSVFFQVFDESDPYEIYDFKEASMIIGQESFDTVVTAFDSLHFRGSAKCAVSSQNMFAASTLDNGFGRILLWKNIPDKLGLPADIVLGRFGFNQLTGGTSASLMSNSRGLAFSQDGNKLLVSDGHRILIWNSIPDTSGTPADVVIGANDFEDNGLGNIGVSANRFNFINDLLVTPDGKLIVCDRLRVLIFNTIPIVNNASADVVIFQPDFISEETGISDRRVGGRAFIKQAALSNCGRLFIALGYYENRVLVFNQIPVVNDTPADYVLGSSDMFSLRSPIDGYSKYLGSNGVAVSYDDIVAISGENWSIGYSRIHLYKSLPSLTDQRPTHVLGQPTLDHIFEQGNSRRAVESTIEGLTFDNKGNLYACSRFSPKILVFKLKNDTYTKLNTIEAKGDFEIYPNPADGFFTIRHNAQTPVSNVLIYNLQGKLVYQQTFNDTSGEINLNPNLSSGFYLVIIQDGGKSEVKKLIIR